MFALVKFFRGVENNKCASDGEMSGDGKLLPLLVSSLLVRYLIGWGLMGGNTDDCDKGPPDGDKVFKCGGVFISYVRGLE